MKLFATYSRRFKLNFKPEKRFSEKFTLVLPLKDLTIDFCKIKWYLQDFLFFTGYSWKYKLLKKAKKIDFFKVSHWYSPLILNRLESDFICCIGESETVG